MVTGFVYLKRTVDKSIVVRNFVLAECLAKKY